jgi:hypothetical protein
MRLSREKQAVHDAVMAASTVNLGDSSHLKVGQRVRISEKARKDFHLKEDEDEGIVRSGGSGQPGSVSVGGYGLWIPFGELTPIEDQEL